MIHNVFSGEGKYKNDPASENIKSVGPIPAGQYLISALSTVGPMGKHFRLYSSANDWQYLHPLNIFGKILQHATESEYSGRQAGSGLFGIVVEPPGPVVVVDEQQQADPVHPVALAEGERLAHEPRQPLPQGVVPTLDMTRLAVALVRRPCPSLRAGSPGSPWRRRPRSP